MIRPYSKFDFITKVMGLHDSLKYYHFSAYFD
jgi:hypothetical protein